MQMSTCITALQVSGLLQAISAICLSSLVKRLVKVDVGDSEIYVLLHLLANFHGLVLRLFFLRLA